MNDLEHNMYFMLDENRNVVPAKSFKEWGEWFHKSNRRVSRQIVAPNIQVSTVFLGMNHNFTSEDPPILWETMVFIKGEGGEMSRCSGTWQDAEAMHNKMVEKVQSFYEQAN